MGTRISPQPIDVERRREEKLGNGTRARRYRLNPDQARWYAQHRARRFGRMLLGA